MKTLIALFISLTLAAPRLACAESRDQKLLNESLEAGGRTFGQELIRGTVDSLANESAAAAAQSTSTLGHISPGSYVVFAISLGLSIVEFVNAKTDKGKGFAVANAAAGAIGVAFPPIGLIAVAVVLVVQLVDGALSAAHAKALMAIYQHINELLEEANHKNLQMALAEKAQFDADYANLIDAGKVVGVQRDFLEKNCMHSEQMDNLGKVESCLRATITLVSGFRRIVRASEDVLNPHTRQMTSELYFKYANVDRKEFSAKLENYKSALNEMTTHLDETLGAYGKWTVQVVNELARRDTRNLYAYEYKAQCTANANRLNLQILALSFPKTFKNIQMFANARIENMDQLRQGLSEFKHSDCEEVRSGDDTVDHDYEEANNQLKQTVRIFL